MASAKAFLAILGVAFALAGVYVAASFDPLVGIACLVVGAFLLILPFSRGGPEE